MSDIGYFQHEVPSRIPELGRILGMNENGCTMLGDHIRGWLLESETLSGRRISLTRMYILREGNVSLGDYDIVLHSRLLVIKSFRGRLIIPFLWGFIIPKVINVILTRFKIEHLRLIQT